MLTAPQIQLITDTVPILRESGEALTAYFYNRMLRLNPELKEVFNMGHQRTGDQSKALASAVLAYAANIENLAVLGSAVNHIITKHVSLNIQPEQYAIVGENLLASISEVLNVPMESELIEAWNIAYTQLANILIEGEKARYLAERSIENGWDNWREFEVIKKEQESAEITSFYLKPKDQQSVVAYKAGQYISIRLFVPELDCKQPRQYTVSHYGLEDCYRISVKREDAKEGLAAGYVSTVLHRDVEVGDIVEVSAPNGVFYLQNSDKPKVLISAGVGITPMMAMLHQLAKDTSGNDITFIHACRNDQVFAFNQEISELQQQLPQLQTYLACEQNHSEIMAPDTIGRLSLSEVSPALLPKDADYYICGPDAFMLIQAESLKQYGIDESQIFMERFNTGNI